VQKTYPNARFATPEEDAMYAVDIIVEGKAGIQVKPKTYKQYNSQNELNKAKNDRFKLKTGMNVYWAYYDDKDWEIEKK
jgi:hypothetical protein